MAQAQRKKYPEDDGYVPFRERFKRWWDDDDPKPEAKVKIVKKKPTPGSIGPDEIAVSSEPAPNLLWPKERVTFCQRLWGAGDFDETFEPGGSEYVAELLKPAAIASKKSLVDLSAGLGGGIRRLANDMGMWVTGMEPDPELASAAHALSVKAGLSKQAPVMPYKPETLDLPEKKFHVVLLRERLFRMDSRPDVLAKIRATLKPGGYFVMTDFALPDDAKRSDTTVPQWLELNPDLPSPWTGSGYRRILNDLGFDIRSFETDNAPYCSMIFESWNRLIEGIDTEELTRPFVDRMMHEAEYWAYVDRALRAGALNYLKVLAMVPSEDVVA